MQDHRPGEGHPHHRRRQEHRAERDRERAQGLALRQGGGRHRRPPHPYLVALIGIELETVGDWAQHARHRLHHLSRPVREAEVRELSRASSTKSTRASRRSSRSRSSGCCPRSSTTRTASSPRPRRSSAAAIADAFGDAGRRACTREARDDRRRADPQPRPRHGQRVRAARPRLRHHLQVDQGDQLRPAGVHARRARCW